MLHFARCIKTASASSCCGNCQRNQDLTPEQIARVQEVIRETGALDELEVVITRLTDEAIAAVQNVPFAQTVRDEMITLAEYVSWRTV